MERGKIIETLSKTASKEGERKVRARLCVCVCGGGGSSFPLGTVLLPIITLTVEGGGEGSRTANT